MLSKGVIVNFGEVVDTNDVNDGGRIKIRVLEVDGTTPYTDIPYSFPLLPKTIQTVPKLGETCLVIFQMLNNGGMNRFFIGPVISQQQYFEYDKSDRLKGTSTSLLKGESYYQPLERLSNYSDLTKGAFPKKTDTALVGRKSEDIIVRDNEIELRAGIRQKVNSIDNPSLVGNVAFNSSDPAFVLVRYDENKPISSKFSMNSVADVVANKVNILSNTAITKINSENLISDEEHDSLMSDLHQLPFGDKLVTYLTHLRAALNNHLHAGTGMVCDKIEPNTLTMNNDVYPEMLSNDVRIS
jgi:hypothetical protein